MYIEALASGTRSSSATGEFIEELCVTNTTPNWKIQDVIFRVELNCKQIILKIVTSLDFDTFEYNLSKYNIA